MNWQEFVAALDAADDVVSTAHRLFPELSGIEPALAELVRSVDGETQLREMRRIRVPNTEPTAWPVVHRPGRYEIVLNLYDRTRFDELLRAGTITPHRHHFSFASVVLHGRFAHFLYTNEGELDAPVLSPLRQESVGRGDRLLLHWATYHCVLAPRPETVSLMVRGVKVAANPFTGDDDYALGHLASDRERLAAALDEAAGTPGDRVEQEEKTERHHARTD